MANNWAAGAVAIAQRTLGTVLPSLLGAQAMRAALDSEQGRVDLQLNAALAYAGGFPDPLRVKPGDIRDTVRVNLVRPLVQATVAFLFGEPPAWDLAGDGETDPDQNTPAEAWMSETLEAMHWPARLLNLGINGAVHGTAYWRLREADADHPRPYLQELPPECMSVQTDPRDIDAVRGYTYQRDDVPGPDGKPQLWRQRWTRADDGQSWTMVEETAAFDGARWIQQGEPLLWPKPWPPILHCQNLPEPNAVYGAPDITQTVIEANMAINLSATASARIERHHASPRVWVSGMPNSTINMSIGGIIYLDNENAKIGQLVPAVNGQEGMAFRAELHDYLCEEAQTPSIVLGRTDPGQSRPDPSGVALKTKLWPLLVKTQMKQQTYGPLLCEALRRLWELGGFGPDCRAVLTWKEHLPTDPKEEAETLQLHGQLGVSEETILEKLGYNPDVERAQRAAEASDDLAQQQGRLAQLKAQQLMAGSDQQEEPQQ